MDSEEERRAKHATYQRAYWNSHPEFRERQKEKRRQYFLKPGVKERYAAHQLRYRNNNIEAARKRARQWHIDNPEKVRAQILARRGTTLEWFRNQLIGQAGRCAICGFVFPSSKATHVDHDHKTGRVRALLCSHCNVLLGAARDRPKILFKAAAYLRSSECPPDDQDSQS